MRILPAMQNEAIRYLNYQVREIQNTDPPIHNYLLSLYTLEVGIPAVFPARTAATI